MRKRYQTPHTRKESVPCLFSLMTGSDSIVIPVSKEEMNNMLYVF